MPSDPKVSPITVLDIISNCRVMLRFALIEALDISAELRGDIATLDIALMRHGIDPITALPSALFDAIPLSQTAAVSSLTTEMHEVPLGAPTTELNLDLLRDGPQLAFPELAIKVHSALSHLVAPATAYTLQYSEPTWGKHGVFGGMPPLVRAASWIALVCAIGFVVTALPVASNNRPAINKSAESTEKGATSGDDVGTSDQAKVAPKKALTEKTNP